MNYKLGKKPARNTMKLRFSSFASSVSLPTPPKSYGHEGLIGKSGWLMLANDQYSDCVWAGAAHETMMHSRIAGKPVMFDSLGVLGDYAANTGFDPKKPETDQGDDMESAAKYRRDVGVLDTKGNRHKVTAYLALNPGNLDHLYHALYLFNAVGIGLRLPDSAIDQTDKKQVWDVRADAKVEGGHYVSLVGRHYGELRVVTWGAIQPMTEAFLKKYCDEAVTYIFPESLVNQKSPEGFDYDYLAAALKQLT